ncbi:ureidoglycolate lyase [Enterovibrio norvegicus]|uniref:Ureidoglycolate lyase n=1 Tax=Enterovibrio norvegicus DSM 15893 TaxID=1121869 RepID=A0A1I5Q2D0_9GAMM|nr:ureidoglycolate lyase [Enterovibrio norvegicus]SFP40524.1 ureidoglycolate lyase [Enterovibrio norvegicus DSM 15893]
MRTDVLLKIEPLTRAAFAEFGDVIEAEDREFFMINGGSTSRYHKLATTEVDEGARVIINIFEAMPLQYPLHIAMLERHPKGSQAFIPLQCNNYLVVVAPRGNLPEKAGIRAFYAKGTQGVNYHAGVWHHPVLALKDHDRFLVVDREGEGNNCDEHFFSAETKVVLALDGISM